MKQLIAFLSLLFLCLAVNAANPSFSDFDPTQFNVNPNLPPGSVKISLAVSPTNVTFNVFYSTNLFATNINTTVINAISNFFQSVFTTNEYVQQSFISNLFVTNITVLGGGNGPWIAAEEGIGDNTTITNLTVINDFTFNTVDPGDAPILDLASNGIVLAGFDGSQFVGNGGGLTNLNISGAAGNVWTNDTVNGDVHLAVTPSSGNVNIQIPIDPNAIQFSQFLLGSGTAIQTSTTKVAKTGVGNSYVTQNVDISGAGTYVTDPYFFFELGHINTLDAWVLDPTVSGFTAGGVVTAYKFDTYYNVTNGQYLAAFANTGTVVDSIDKDGVITAKGLIDNSGNAGYFVAYQGSGRLGMTNNAQVLTNILFKSLVSPTNGVSSATAIDFSVPEATTNISAAIAFTSIVNWNQTNYNYAIRHIIVSGGNQTLTVGAGWGTDPILRTTVTTYTLTNGCRVDLLVGAQINFFTNANILIASP